MSAGLAAAAAEPGRNHRTRSSGTLSLRHGAVDAPKRGWCAVDARAAEAMVESGEEMSVRRRPGLRRVGGGDPSP